MKKILALILLVALVAVFSFTPAALADTKSQIQCGVNTAAGVPCGTAPSAGGLTELVKKIINILSVLAGAAAVIMVIVGGFRYVTSAGSESGVSGAKKTILYALVGLAVISLAQVIVHFVLNSTS